MTAIHREGFHASIQHQRNVRTATVLLILAGFAVAYVLQSG
ncbi:MAG: hypothetical protein WB493_02750 [Anaeromyxobacteraceae bacterium]